MRVLSALKTGVLFSLLIAIFMLAGWALGSQFGLMIGLILGGVANLIAYYYSDKIALASMRAQPVTRAEAPWLIDTVERLAERANLPMPRVYVCPQEAPNAFATGRDPKHAAVAITAGMLRNFPQHEVEAVLAHELAHVKHRDVLISTIAATMAGALSYLGYIFLFGGGRDSESPLAAVGAILTIILAPIAAMIIQLAISRQREFGADAYGGELCGNPMNLAAALNRLEGLNRRIPTDGNPAYQSLFIVQPLSARERMASWMSTHPPVAKRIEALRRQAAAMQGARA